MISRICAMLAKLFIIAVVVGIVSTVEFIAKYKKMIQTITVVILFLIFFSKIHIIHNRLIELDNSARNNAPFYTPRIYTDPDYSLNHLMSLKGFEVKPLQFSARKRSELDYDVYATLCHTLFPIYFACKGQECWQLAVSQV